MVKLIALVEAKQGLSPAAFRDHYETCHVPMAKRLLPMTKDYRRNYLDRAAWLTRGGDVPVPQADVITETWFETEADYQAFLARVAEPAVQAEIAADEAKFIKSATVCMIRVDEAVG